MQAKKNPQHFSHRMIPDVKVAAMMDYLTIPAIVITSDYFDNHGGDINNNAEVGLQVNLKAHLY